MTATEAVSVALARIADAESAQDDLNAFVYRTAPAQRLVTSGDHYGWSFEIDVRLTRTFRDPLERAAERTAALAYEAAADV